VRQRVRGAGWGLIAAGVVAVTVLVSVGGFRADTVDAFNRWVGWATIAAVPLAALGVLLVLWDRLSGGEHASKADRRGADDGVAASRAALGQLGNAPGRQAGKTRSRISSIAVSQERSLGRTNPGIIDVTMLGGQGVGKTTLLASMYEQLESVAGTTDLDVVPRDFATSARMHEYLMFLRSLPRGSWSAGGGLPGTSEIREYKFDVGMRGQRPSFVLRFTDYPGGSLLRPGDHVEHERLQRALERADVILVGIDTPALVEMSGRYHQQINAPLVVRDVLVKMLQEDTPRLIILAPLKCETYVSSPQDSEALAHVISEAYRPLLAYMGSDAVHSRVACVLTPVQTIGSVVLTGVEMHAEGQPVFHFRIHASLRGAAVGTKTGSLPPLAWRGPEVAGVF
jgi:hypothetical protein